MSGSSDARLRLFRGIISEATANSHAAIKACWIVIFVGGTANFLSSLDKVGVCSGLLERTSFTVCPLHLFDRPLFDGVILPSKIRRCLRGSARDTTRYFGQFIDAGGARPLASRRKTGHKLARALLAR